MEDGNGRFDKGIGEKRADAAASRWYEWSWPVLVRPAGGRYE